MFGHIVKTTQPKLRALMKVKSETPDHTCVSHFESDSATVYICNHTVVKWLFKV